MSMQRIGALVGVELKKLYRDIMTLAVLLLMPLGLTLVLYLALSGVSNDYYAIPVKSHFEYLLPGIMGYAVIYMGMMIALALVDYRLAGLLKRVETTPVSAWEYLGSLTIANVFIAVVQALIVLLVVRLTGYVPLGGVTGLLLACVFLVLLAIAAVGLGLMVAAVAKDTGTASGLSMIFILPMMMFGTFLAVFSEATRTVAKFTPNYYVTDSLSIIFHTGDLSNPTIYTNLLILAIVSVVALVAGVLLFKRAAFR